MLKSILYTLSILVAALILRNFFYIEYLRANIEDTAFDIINTFIFSKKETTTDGANTFLLLVDNKYLKSQKLLNEDNKTTYGYIFPRNYLANIINNIDTIVLNLETENYPSALFIDYDTTYLSDMHNKVPTNDDIKLLNTLKKDRPYTIYLPLLSNYNFIYHSTDKVIVKKLKSGKLKFVSTALTSSSDGVSRRYYPYEIFNNLENQKSKFFHIAIELYKAEHPNTNFNLNDISLKKRYFLENRILFKNMILQENTNEYNYWQSKWKKLSAMSANYPLDNIYEKSFKNAVIMIGAKHSNNQDTFIVDNYLKKISGLEMQANAYMTIQYFNGIIKELPEFYIFLIITVSIFTISIFILYYAKRYIIKINNKISTLKNKLIRDIIQSAMPHETTQIFLLATIVFFIISYYLLTEMHYWFNWMIPSIAYIPYQLGMGFAKLIKKEDKC